jgi:Fic family protein
MDPEKYRKSSAGSPILTQRGYWVFVPAPLPPAIPWSNLLVSILSDADRALSKFAGYCTTISDTHLYTRPFLALEALLSSRIDGIRTSLEGLFTYTTDPESGQLTSSENQPVNNCMLALEYGLSRLMTMPVCLRLTLTLHERLLAGFQESDVKPGEFRKIQNWIGHPGSTLESARYVPPPVPEMHELLEGLEKFIYAAHSLPPLIRLGLIHYQFEAIHPFLVGNGCVGRMLITLLLVEFGLLPLPLLYLSVYFEANRSEYLNHLQSVSQRGDWGAWLLFFLEGVRRGSQDALAHLQRLEELRLGYRQMLAGERNAGRLMDVVNFLFGQPIVTIRGVEAAIHARDYKIAQRYVEKLGALGILREITGRKRDRIYRADDILDAIQVPLQ